MTYNPPKGWSAYQQSETSSLVVLNFSGGKQSSALLWAVLLGDLPRPEHLLVLNADPGMESTATYEYVRMLFSRCEEQGIEVRTAPGPNLLEDLLSFQASGRTRLDNPPYWTKGADGERGQMTQKCTREYKIRPMDRVIREVLARDFGVPRASSRIPAGLVEKWIGFTLNEVQRIKPAAQKYVRFSYPLIDMGMRNRDVLAYYEARGLPLPPRSVCNACFANGPAAYADMAENRPRDWGQALAVDRAVRDMSQLGVKRPVFLTDRLVPLPELVRQAGGGADTDGWSCDSGYCFV